MPTVTATTNKDGIAEFEFDKEGVPHAVTPTEQHGMSWSSSYVFRKLLVNVATKWLPVRMDIPDAYSLDSEHPYTPMPTSGDDSLDTPIEAVLQFFSEHEASGTRSAHILHPFDIPALAEDERIVVQLRTENKDAALHFVLDKGWGERPAIL